MTTFKILYLKYALDLTKNIYRVLLCNSCLLFFICISFISMQVVNPNCNGSQMHKILLAKHVDYIAKLALVKVHRWMCYQIEELNDVS